MFIFYEFRPFLYTKNTVIEEDKT